MVYQPRAFSAAVYYGIAISGLSLTAIMTVVTYIVFRWQMLERRERRERWALRLQGQGHQTPSGQQQQQQQRKGYRHANQSSYMAPRTDPQQQSDGALDVVKEQDETSKQFDNEPRHVVSGHDTNNHDTDNNRNDNASDGTKDANDDPNVENKVDPTTATLPAALAGVRLHGPIILTLAGIHLYLFGLQLRIGWSFWTGLGLVLLAALFFYRNSKALPGTGTTTFSILRRYHATRALLCLHLLVAGISTTTFGYLSAQIAGFRYKGRMPIIGYSVSTDTDQLGRWNKLYAYRHGSFSNRPADQCHIEEAVGLIQVAFGGAWACPNNNNGSGAASSSTYCVTSVSALTCDEPVCGSNQQGSFRKCPSQDTVCTSNEYSAATALTQDCMDDKYAAVAKLQNAGVSYDPDDDPNTSTNDDNKSNDDDALATWPTQVMYGNCETCEAEIAYVFEVEHQAIESAFLLAAVGYVMALVFGVWAYQLRKQHPELLENNTNNDCGISRRWQQQQQQQQKPVQQRGKNSNLLAEMSGCGVFA